MSAYKFNFYSMLSQFPSVPFPSVNLAHQLQSISPEKTKLLDYIRTISVWTDNIQRCSVMTLHVLGPVRK